MKLTSGKTLLSLSVINEYLINEPERKIYVITPPGSSPLLLKDPDEI